ncbi:MAG TPA: hypothetical protein VN894_00040 [Polyangiaceae bacterium]|nr:hypothetical protein [Polyangiaceae bacterium]
MPAVVHAVPHVPQFFGSVFASTQAPLQTVWPVGQEHLPASHEAPVAHAVHVPQCWALAITSTH